MNDLIGTKALALRLGVSQRRVQQMARQGLIPTVRIGGKIMVPAAAWADWLRLKGDQALSGCHANAPGQGS